MPMEKSGGSMQVCGAFDCQNWSRGIACMLQLTADVLGGIRSCKVTARPGRAPLSAMHYTITQSSTCTLEAELGYDAYCCPLLTGSCRCCQRGCATLPRWSEEPPSRVCKDSRVAALLRIEPYVSPSPFRLPTCAPSRRVIRSRGIHQCIISCLC